MEIIKTIEDDLESNYSFLALEDLSFDTEGFDTAESYKNLLKELIKITEIENQIKKINVVKKKNLINIKILTNKGEELKYNVDIDENQDWIDFTFIEQFINAQLLPMMNNNKKFIALPAITLFLQDILRSGFVIFSQIFTSPDLYASLYHSVFIVASLFTNVTPLAETCG